MMGQNWYPGRVKVPFQSEAQRRFLWSKDPEMAKEWEKHTPKGRKLPQKVRKKDLKKHGKKMDSKSDQKTRSSSLKARSKKG